MDSISVQDLKALQDSGESYFLLDVREAHEVADTPMAGMPYHHIPMGDVPSRLAEIPQDTHVVVFCAMGGRSAWVCDQLDKHDYDEVSNLTGGMKAWQEAYANKVA